MDMETGPDSYVEENRDELRDIIMHGTDDFVRALALAALVEFGDDPDLQKVKREVDQAVTEGST